MWSRLYISPRGRCSRRFYWLFGVLAFVPVGMVAGFMLAGSALELQAFYAIFLLLLWPQLAMQIKRWHDIGLSGWMCLLSMIPFLGIVALLVVGLVPGTKGDNRFGPDPLGPRVVSAGAL